LVSLIVTDQVEMEFKKNRQAAILEGMKELKTPQKINVPSVLRQDKSSKAIDTNLTKMKDRIGKLRTRMGNVLENPSRYDKVYQVAQRLFIKRKEIDLYRKSKMRYKIRELAEKRFMLGYPPRKNNDNSIGDAINWEWIVYVAQQKNIDIWIISRDGDYGVTQNSRGFINDWLRQEFRERVHKKRRVVLVPLLSQALKEFEIAVTAEEQEEEEKIAEGSREIALQVDSACHHQSVDNIILG
jgi:hypothetical protein